MKRVTTILLTLALAGLSACAVQPRTDAPAPIEESGAARVERPVTPVQPPPQEQAAETYAYRAPGSATPAPEADPQAEILPQAEKAPSPSMNALPSERATAPATTALPSESNGVSSTPQVAPAPQVVAYTPPPPPTPTLPPAGDALAQQAEQQRQAGDYVGAAATLERALRIQPQEAYLWNRLARVRMEQGLHSQAGNLAARSNALAGDQAQLKQDNWSMIAVARRAGGDTAGAMEAEQKARGG